MVEVYNEAGLQTIRLRCDHGAGGLDYITGGPVSLDSFEEFLVAQGVLSPGWVTSLQAVAAQQGVSTIEVLLADDTKVAGSLYRALAAYKGLAFLDPGTDWFSAEIAPDEVKSCLAQGWVRLRGADGRNFYAAAPRTTRASSLADLGMTGDAATAKIDFIAAPATIRGWIEAAHASTLTDMATGSLRRALPAASAHLRLVRWQKIALVGLAVALVAAAALPWVAITGFLLLAVLFLALALVRLVCLLTAPVRRVADPVDRIPDRDLPVYTLLVPMFREAGVAGQLARALMALDYPASKLDIKLILEEQDTETRTALAGLDLPGCFEIIVAPASLPRTKPKALNYALGYARGSFVAVYDAEDIPEPAQLRKSLAAFAAGPENLGCVQARLGFYNFSHNWLTKQFAVEYAALFDVLLAALSRLGMPLMLGGTSNHFRIQALRRAGGWDPYNVTEDADLGIRFARMGIRCAWLDSITLEEAPTGLGAWLYQRVRWMRGWLQTYFVHMRAPRTTLADLGICRFLVFQMLVGGQLVSALAHPVFMLYLANILVFGGGFEVGGNWLANGLLLINGVNIIAGYGVALAMGVLGLSRCSPYRLLLQVPLMPFYWLLVSLATYWSLWRFAVAPFAWEKTRHHGVRSGLA